MEKNKTIMVVVLVAAIVVIAAAALIIVRDDNEEKRIIDTSDYGKTAGTTLDEGDRPSAESRLWVYGNANEDDVLDEDDLKFLKEVVKGKKTATVLCDANCDGTVDEDDVDYLEQILKADCSSTEIDIYYLDNYVTISKVSWPVKSIAVGYSSGAYLVDLTNLGAKVKMVGGGINSTNWGKISSYFEGLPSYGWEESPDRDAILQNNIDVFCPGYCDGTADPESRTYFKNTGTDVMFMNTCDCSTLPKEDIDRSVVMFAYLLGGDMDKTYKWLDWQDGVISKIETAVKGLNESEKPAMIQFRNAPSYNSTGLYTTAGTGNTSVVHAIWSGINYAGDGVELPSTYNKIDADAILTIIDKYAVDNVIYVVDNEQDGIRQQRDLDVTTKSYYDMLKSSSVDIHYLGLAREACNSPLYVIEMAFYMNVMLPDLSTSVDYESLFEEYFDLFASEDYSAYVDIGNFFVDYGTSF